MDWLQILSHCLLWILFCVAVCVGVYAMIALPIMVITFIFGTIYSFFRLFLPFLPDFWETIGSSSSSSPSKGFDWGEKTEAEKHRDLVEHIRIQQMNEERNRR